MIVGKPKQSGGGFSTHEPKAVIKLQVANGSADQAAEERQAEAMIKQGRLKDAEAIYRNLIVAGTNNPNVYGNLAAICGQTNRSEEALQFLLQAIKINPKHHSSLNNLGNIHRAAGNLDLSIQYHRASLDIISSNPEPWLGLGNALLQKHETEEALACYRKYRLYGGGIGDCSLNVSYALMENGETKEAIQELERMADSPEWRKEAHYNLSMLHMLTGNYKNGWELYENRFAIKRPVVADARPRPTANRASLKSDVLEGKLLFISEQGLGDTLQFMRYIHIIRQQGIEASLAAPPKLHGLIRVSGIDSSPLTPQQANAVTDGSWMPLLSLPGRLDISDTNPLITGAYIKTKPELICKWQRLLTKETRPIIGINWQGDPNHENENLKGRSIPLERFAQIAHNPNISLLSLQKGFGSEQLESCSFKGKFVSCQDQINETWDYLETAAIIANCDLVITSDTSVAHLAGGMGKSTWLLLKKIPEWRWGLKGETTFWYSSIRIFRQKDRGNWDEVMVRVAEELQKHFGL
jgi:Flp pilus assembly protein TadD